MKKNGITLIQYSLAVWAGRFAPDMEYLAIRATYEGRSSDKNFVPEPEDWPTVKWTEYDEPPKVLWWVTRFTGPDLDAKRRTPTEAVIVDLEALVYSMNSKFKRLLKGFDQAPSTSAYRSEHRTGLDAKAATAAAAAASARATPLNLKVKCLGTPMRTVSDTPRTPPPKSYELRLASACVPVRLLV